MQLSAEHNGGENSEQQRLGDEEQQQDDGGGRRVRAAGAPLVSDARHELVHSQAHRVDRDSRDVQLDEQTIHYSVSKCGFHLDIPMLNPSRFREDNVQTHVLGGIE